MEINELIQGVCRCECGKDHACPIDSVIIGDGAISSLSAIASGYSSVLLVADQNTYSVCGDAVARELSGRLCDTLIYQRDGILVPNEEAIQELDSHVTNNVDLIIGIGSGVINDLCKIVSFNHSLPYFIVATAPSMDGYASRGSALILGGMKVTLNADVPRAIIADTSVLADSPFEMIQAGFGDIIGKYSCLNDWRLSSLVNGEYICQRVLDMTYEVVDRTVLLADGIKSRNKDAVGALMEALVAVGILMAYVGNSRPASGSEHHLSHYFEIVGIERGEKYLPHGIDVCFSAIETARLRERLLEIKDISSFEYSFDIDDYKAEIRRIYGSISDGVIELQNKLGWYDIDRVSVYKEKWGEIRSILSDCPSSAQMLSMCSSVGLDYTAFTDLYGKEKIGDALLYAKDLKDRYTVLWMYFDLFGK